MTQAEIGLAIANRGEPRYDVEPVPEARLKDLDGAALARTLTRVAGRWEQPDYPLEAVREAIVNAVLHRDYSNVTRGTQIQVELHPDRLVVRSPGSLYGLVRVEDLGAEAVSSSRNAFLATLLADTYVPRSDRLVAENRASSIPAMIRELRRSGLGRPIFGNLPSRFEVEFSRSPVMEWADPPTSTRDIVATALRRRGRASAAHLVTVAGRSRAAVLYALRALIADGVVEAEGDPQSPQRAYRWVGTD